VSLGFCGGVELLSGVEGCCVGGVSGVVGVLGVCGSALVPPSDVVGVDGVSGVEGVDGAGVDELWDSELSAGFFVSGAPPLCFPSQTTPSMSGR